MTVPSYYFFSGKGGVGKTSMASATAVQFAREGKKVLIVTTDPAANLSDVFEQEIGHRVTSIAQVENLWAMEIDVDSATAEYKENALAPMRGVFPQEIVDVMEEELNSPCTEEMAAFDKFIDFMDDNQFDVIIFDTAPTGHTIRLLELPVDWSRHIDESEQGSGQTCMGPVQILKDSKAKYDRAVELLQDQERTTFIFVIQPEATPIAETKRSKEELAKIGIKSTMLIINGILPPKQCNTPFFKKRSDMQQQYLREIAAQIPVEAKKMFLLDEEIKGIAFLEKVGRMLWKDNQAGAQEDKSQGVSADSPVDAEHEYNHVNVSHLLVPSKEVIDDTKSIFFAGKGGVGKTSLSCITAVWLAKQGYKTLLVTTDPASHLSEVFEQTIAHDKVEIKGIKGLEAVKIDPKRAAEEYKEKILADAKEKYSEEIVSIMREQLDSPCTEEMAVFHKFLDYADSKDHQVVVYDTAPTGHTLRLLELPIDWSNQIAVKSSASVEGSALNHQAKEKFDAVINRLQNSDKTTFSFVVYPENTPIMEAHRAVEELKTVNISTPLIVANLVLPAEECVNDYFAKRRKMQVEHLNQMKDKFDGTILQLPMMEEEIKGLDVLVKAGKILYGDS